VSPAVNGSRHDDKGDDGDEASARRALVCRCRPRDNSSRRHDDDDKYVNSTH
jgi:hypothetical protein